MMKCVIALFDEADRNLKHPQDNNSVTSGRLRYHERSAGRLGISKAFIFRAVPDNTIGWYLF